MYRDFEYENRRDAYERAYQQYGQVPAPQEPAPSTQSKKRNRRGAGMVAAMLAVSVVSGAAGGGATWALMQSNAETSIVQAQAEQQPVVQQEQPVVQQQIAGLDGSSYDIAGIVAKASDSVVEVSTQVTVRSPFFGEMTSTGSGSGVILTEDGYVVTNDHVVEDAGSITVRTADGTEYEAALVGTDEKTDLAVLKISATGLAPATFADSDSVAVGQLAVAIGNPLGTLGGTVTDGIISARDREITIGNETMTLLQTSAAVNPGNSGGGLFNASAQLVGIVNAKSAGSDIEGLGFAIPSNTVQQVVWDIIEHGYVTGRPELGISIIDINDLQSARRYRLSEPGVYVAAVSRENGLQAGDRVLSVNGQEVESGSQLVALVQECGVGDVMEIVVMRDGGEVQVSVLLSEQAPVAEELPESAAL